MNLRKSRRKDEIGKVDLVTTFCSAATGTVVPIVLHDVVWERECWSFSVSIDDGLATDWYSGLRDIDHAWQEVLDNLSDYC